MGADGCRAAPAPPPLSVLPMVLSPEEGNGTMLSNELPPESTCEFIQKTCSFRSLLQSDWKNQAKRADFLLLIGVDWTAMNSLVGTHHTFSSFFPSETVTSAVNIIFKADFSGYERGTFFLSFFSISIGIDLSCHHISHCDGIDSSLTGRSCDRPLGLQKTVSFPAFNIQYEWIQKRPAASHIIFCQSKELWCYFL